MKYKAEPRVKKLIIEDCKVTRNGDTVEIHLPFKKSDPRYPWIIEDFDLLLQAAKKV